MLIPPDFKMCFVRARTVGTRTMYYREIIPLCLRNGIPEKKVRPNVSACTEELQGLFQCLRKWDFNDVHCEKQHRVYVECAFKADKIMKDFKKATKDGTLGEKISPEGCASLAQMNRLMAMFPQPGLGTHPFRKMKRLPTQSYADDIFHRQKKSGKPS